MTQGFEENVDQELETTDQSDVPATGFDVPDAPEAEADVAEVVDESTEAPEPSEEPVDLHLGTGTIACGGAA